MSKLVLSVVVLLMLVAVVQAETVIRNGLTTIDGDLIVNGLISSTSDKRLKNHIKPFKHAEKVVMSLQPVSYIMNEDENQKPQIGFIAQDVEKVLPEVVGRTMDGFKTVDYSKLTTVLVGTIHALKKDIGQIDQLKEENRLLKMAVCEINISAEICK